MTNALLDAVRRYTEAHAGSEGLAQTPVPGLATVRATSPSGLVHAISRPLVCLVLQGAKQVAMGAQAFAFAAGDSLLITADVPTVSQVTRASIAAPCLSLVLELDLAVVADLAVQMKAGLADGGVRVEPTDAEVADAALRLMRLLGRPKPEPVLHALRMRELHYWLLAGRHGAAIRPLGWPEGHARRVARAVAVLRAEFARPLPVERLAAVAGMSSSSFYRHFLAVTCLSPSQRLAEIPGIGPVGAMLLRMKTPEPELFRSGRQCAAWVGLTPRGHSTAGKARLGIITRAGDERLRSVLVVGATAVIQQARRSGKAPSWLAALLKRKSPKLAAVALANTMARIAWKLMLTGEAYTATPAPAAAGAVWRSARHGEHPNCNRAELMPDLAR